VENLDLDSERIDVNRGAIAPVLAWQSLSAFEADTVSNGSRPNSRPHSRPHSQAGSRPCSRGGMRRPPSHLEQLRHESLHGLEQLWNSSASSLPGLNKPWRPPLVPSNLSSGRSICKAASCSSKTTVSTSCGDSSLPSEVWTPSSVGSREGRSESIFHLERGPSLGRSPSRSPSPAPTRHLEELRHRRLLVLRDSVATMAEQACVAGILCAGSEATSISGCSQTPSLQAFAETRPSRPSTPCDGMASPPPRPSNNTPLPPADGLPGTQPDEDDELPRYISVADDRDISGHRLTRQASRCDTPVDVGRRYPRCDTPTDMKKVSSLPNGLGMGASSDFPVSNKKPWGTDERSQLMEAREALLPTRRCTREPQARPQRACLADCGRKLVGR